MVPQRTPPLLVDDMREIKAFINLGRYAEAAIWALWFSQWQGVLTGSYILKPTQQKARKWNPERDKNLDRISWEEVRPEVKHGCSIKLRWKLQTTKIDQVGTQGLEKIFMLDLKSDSLSTEQAIQQMVHLHQEVSAERNESPLFLDAQTGKEIRLWNLRRELVNKEKQKGLPKALVKRHSPGIGGATAYTKNTAEGDSTAGFMGFWAFGA